MVAAVSQQLYPSRPFVPAELDSALAFLQAFQDKPRGRGGALEAPSLLVLSMEQALLRVRKAGALGGGEGAKALLEGVRQAVRGGQATLAGLREGEDPAVPASVHRAAAEYHKLVGPASACHASTLLYLGAVQPESLPAPERCALALDIALASLVGEGIFNFGEVLEQPVLGELAGTPHAWLCDLLRAFQVGDIAASDRCVGANRAAFDAQPTLRAASGLLSAKIKLLALMEMVLKRPTTERVIGFKDIAAVVMCAEDQVRLGGGAGPRPAFSSPSSSSSPLPSPSLLPHTPLTLPPPPPPPHPHAPLATAFTQVELLAMRAMSLGLIKGSLDEVERTLTVTFVQPRVLNKGQLAVIKERVDSWLGRCSETLALLEKATPAEIFS